MADLAAIKLPLFTGSETIDKEIFGKNEN